VDEDGISSVVKSFVDFEKEETQIRKENAKKDEKVERVTEIYGGTLNGQLYTSEQVMDQIRSQFRGIHICYTVDLETERSAD